MLYVRFFSLTQSTALPTMDKFHEFPCHSKPFLRIRATRKKNQYFSFIQEDVRRSSEDDLTSVERKKQKKVMCDIAIKIEAKKVLHTIFRRDKNLISIFFPPSFYDRRRIYIYINSRFAGVNLKLSEYLNLNFNVFFLCLLRSKVFICTCVCWCNSIYMAF